MSKAVNWQGKWITSTVMPPDGIKTFHWSPVPSYGAPWLRTVFECPAKLKTTRLCIAAPGWFECYINGKRVGDQVLAPITDQFTKHVSYLVFDVTKLLKPGKNAIAVLIGNGWYNCQTPEVWQFHDAPWRNIPSLLLQIEETASGTVLLASDQTWKGVKSKVYFNALRNGEYQDLRINDDGVSTLDFDDSAAPHVEIANPPPGALIEQTCEQCAVIERIEPVGDPTRFDNQYLENKSLIVYDFGRNITGWCEIDADALEGDNITISYSEKIDFQGMLNRENIDQFVRNSDFQMDRYIFAGKKATELHPHFTYHGFRYAAVNIPKHVLENAKPSKKQFKVTACFIHNKFNAIGSFHTDGNQMLDAVLQMNRHTYLCNYTGIPTDCPHREKNGWTGDANLAFETGAWNFDISHASEHFSQVLMDTQRRTGQLCGIAPTGGWGYNWGSGPAWDSYIFEAAYQNWMMFGDDSIIRKHYDGMALYLDYCRKWHDKDGVVNFGIGDWCPFRNSTYPSVGLTSSGFYYQDTLRMAQFAQVLGKKNDAKKYTAEAQRISDGINREFAQDDGGYDNNSLTALAAPLYFGFAKDSKKTLAKLVALMRKDHHISDYGILGAKFVLRALGDNGYKDDLLKVLTQPELPGWGYWVKIGATTFREHWDGKASQCHIMFGDPSACIYRYFAGIAPTKPGFKEFTLTPATNLKELPDFDCTYDSASGTIRSALKSAKDGKRQYTCAVPEGTTAILTLNGKTHSLSAGEHKFNL